MALQGTLSEGRTLFIENNDDQTQITLQSGDTGQQQSQGSGFTTGPWRQAPVLYQAPQGTVLQVEGNERFYFLIAASTVRSLLEAPALQECEPIPLRETAPTKLLPPIPPLPPMAPMPPMKPMAPMEMKMGNMEMKMGAAQENSDSQKRFCTQCGRQAQTDDKFCARCGQKLRA